MDAGIRMESELPHLVALEDDLLSTGVLLYHLKVFIWQSWEMSGNYRKLSGKC